jgi:1-acyl-sn-glycerol-3-phosphate acyltransferase
MILAGVGMIVAFYTDSRLRYPYSVHQAKGFPMNPQAFKRPPRWWSPKLNWFWWRLWRLFRRRIQFKVQRLNEIEIRGLEHLRGALSHDFGILITPNHSGHADPLILYKTAEGVNRGFYFMAAWQVLAKHKPIDRFILRQHGVFSVDREGADMKAFRQAVEILITAHNPLVIFPEGEVYHVNDRITPFRDGPVAIALTAAKKADRPIACIPCAIKYQYLTDPTDELCELMGRLEEQILWRRRDDLSLMDRIYRFAEGALALKELEYLGATQHGPLPSRINSLSSGILSAIENRQGIASNGLLLPERIKAVRRAAIEQIAEPTQEHKRIQASRDLDDAFVVAQLFSYPGDYVSAKPTIERMAETLDKFEEDVFKVPTATIRATRKAVVSFGEPMFAEHANDRKTAIHALTGLLEQRVQELLDRIESPQRT